MPKKNTNKKGINTKELMKKVKEKKEIIDKEAKLKQDKVTTNISDASKEQAIGNPNSYSDAQLAYDLFN